MSFVKKMNKVFDEELSINLLFNHIRNIGLCVLLLSIGVFLRNADCTVYTSPIMGQDLAALFIIAVAAVLSILNVMQLTTSVANRLRTVNRLFAFLAMGILTLWILVVIFFVFNTQVLNLLNSLPGACIK